MMICMKDTCLCFKRFSELCVENANIKNKLDRTNSELSSEHDGYAPPWLLESLPLHI